MDFYLLGETAPEAVLIDPTGDAQRRPRRRREVLIAARRRRRHPRLAEGAAVKGLGQRAASRPRATRAGAAGAALLAVVALARVLP